MRLLRYARHGIPAFVVENDVLPALEAAANSVLAHLPGGFAVQFLTQRATKTTSELKETLDILINGRQFETFSCGEQYRIALALRVAMAELAARRSGLRLETLVVDEGFSSQDSEGRQALVEAVAFLARAECFARIVVITHIFEVVNQLEPATGGALRRVVIEDGEVVDDREPGIDAVAAD